MAWLAERPTTNGASIHIQSQKLQATFPVSLTIAVAANHLRSEFPIYSLRPLLTVAGKLNQQPM